MTNRKITVCKEYKFEAAHRLTGYGGPCENLHGHSYKVQVTLGAPDHWIKENDYMVMDFSLIDEIVEDLIDDLDHSYLNDTLKRDLPGDGIPTAELIAGIFFDHVDESLSDINITTEAYVERIRVYETAKCYAEVVCDE